MQRVRSAWFIRMYSNGGLVLKSPISNVQATASDMVYYLETDTAHPPTTFNRDYVKLRVHQGDPPRLVAGFILHKQVQFHLTDRTDIGQRMVGLDMPYSGVQYIIPWRLILEPLAPHCVNVRNYVIHVPPRSTLLHFGEVTTSWLICITDNAFTTVLYKDGVKMYMKFVGWTSVHKGLVGLDVSYSWVYSHGFTIYCHSCKTE
jgi:hypothetical protein